MNELNSAQAIGVFDSGLGGISVVRAIIDLLPNEHLIYFGDTARVPYGSKSEETVIRFAPPLIIDKETIDWAMPKIRKVLLME